MDGSIPGATLCSWKPAVAGIREVLHARFTTHAYPPHTHDSWTVFIVDDGAIRYDLDRHPRGAAPDLLSVLPPHVVHDGRPATGDGFRKRVLYLETSVLAGSTPRAIGSSGDNRSPTSLRTSGSPTRRT